jgi:hypothetical protein
MSTEIVIMGGDEAGLIMVVFSELTFKPYLKASAAGGKR